MDSHPRHSGIARIYLGPEPEGSGPHPGYRGPMTIDAAGVHVSEKCDYLATHAEAGEWESLADIPMPSIVIPWHRVDQLEWHGCGWEESRAAA